MSSNAPVVEERGTSAVIWQRGPRHKFYEDRYRLLCFPIPLVRKAMRGELFAVCDGVGSAPKGMAAAQEVCNTLIRFFEPGQAHAANVETILELLLEANETIRAWGVIDGTDRAAGACAGTVIWITDKLTAHVLHVGDTAALLIRDGNSTQLTSVQDSTEGHLINYFGLIPLKIEITITQLQEGDRLLLLTDGITKSLYNSHIVGIIESCPTRPGSLLALLGAARAAGSGDDATALLIDIEDRQ